MTARTGGSFEVSEDAALDPEIASAELGGREFIFDVQGHFVGQNDPVRRGLGGVDDFIKDVFLDRLAVLKGQRVVSGAGSETAGTGAPHRGV